MDARAGYLRMSRTEYLKTLARIDLHARPEFLAVPADSVAAPKKADKRDELRTCDSHLFAPRYVGH